jgi:hypothetical protein
MNFRLLEILLLAFATCCSGQHKQSKPNITIVKCDSIYLNKNITIKLLNFDDEEDGYVGDKNTILEIQQITKNKTRTLIKDSIFSKAQKIEFADFNNDRIKDVLVQNISDVRSNWSYNLYVYDPKETRFRKVTGFEKIKNPVYNSQHDIVESYIVSGNDWVCFYKIVDLKVYDYQIEIEDRHDDGFDIDYKNAMDKILRTKL